MTYQSQTDQLKNYFYSFEVWILIMVAGFIISIIDRSFLSIGFLIAGSIFITGKLLVHEWKKYR